MVVAVAVAVGLVVAQFFAESIVGRRQLRTVFAERGWALIDARRRVTVLSHRVKFDVTVRRHDDLRDGTALVGSWWSSPLWQAEPRIEFELDQRSEAVHADDGGPRRST